MRKRLSPRGPWVSIILVLAMIVTGVLLFRGMTAPRPLRVVLVLDGQAGDGSFGFSAVAGMKKAAKDLKISARYLECLNDPKNYLPRLADAAATSDMVICVGSGLAQQLSAAAQANPKISFALIDGAVAAPNVVSAVFRQNESAYLAGILAARLTTHGGERLNPQKVIGLIMGDDIPVLRDFRVGYEAGAQSVDPKIQVLVDYAGDWGNRELGAKLAAGQHERGADVIFQAAGLTGLGVLDAAREGKYYAIGSDTPQDDLAPGDVVASAIKRVDNAVYDLIRAATQKTLPLGKKLSLGLTEDAVGLAWGKQTSALVAPEIRAQVNDAAEKIRKGEIEVPSAL